uniref:Major facilitator superfamily MFS_1 n=1 Tax=Solibacter usitatus (strain Ellin6076) TaxID=234267 RepID=Q01PD3_SOLUE
MARRAEVGLVYAAGLVQGLALVTFPAASSIFTNPDGFGFSASRYGMMFIPQVILAIAASSLGPGMARRWTLKRVLRAGISANFLAMILLALSGLLQHTPGVAYAILLAATGCLGFGFGTVVMALNTYAEEFSPGGEDRAVLSLNALLGAGTALAPLLVAVFTSLGAWWLLPLTVASALAGLLVLSARQPLPASAVRTSGGESSPRLPRRFWLFAAAVLLYGIAETLSGNWSGVYLTAERGVSAGGASFALTAFWAAVTLGRILFAGLSSKTTVRWIYVGLPVLLILAFQAVLRVRTEAGGIAAFSLAGLGCSAFFPLCISLSGQEFPRFAAATSGELVAFYQVGYGVAAFGVEPLRDLTGQPMGSIYRFGSLVAAVMLAVAFLVVARGPRAHG